MPPASAGSGSLICSERLRRIDRLTVTPGSCCKLDLSRFDAASLIAFTVTKETDYWTETDGGIPPRGSADCTDQRSDRVTLAHIKEQSRLSLGSYGRPRMTEELKQIGLDVGHRRVGRLLRQNGISVVRTRKHMVTTDSNHKFNIAPNLLDRNLTANEPNQKWAADISYIWMRQGWLYLAVILDLHSRRVIGWADQSPQEA